MSSKIKGLKELEKKLQALGSKVGGNALRNAAKDSMKPVENMAKALAPVGSSDHYAYEGPKSNRTKSQYLAPGHTKRSIRIRANLSRDKQTAYARVGVLMSAFYSVQFIELGTKNIQADPWLENSFRYNQNLVEALFKRKLQERIAKATK